MRNSWIWRITLLCVHSLWLTKPTIKDAFTISKVGFDEMICIRHTQMWFFMRFTEQNSEIVVAIHTVWASVVCANLSGWLTSNQTLGIRFQTKNYNSTIKSYLTSHNACPLLIYSIVDQIGLNNIFFMIRLSASSTIGLITLTALTQCLLEM